MKGGMNVKTKSFKFYVQHYMAPLHKDGLKNDFKLIQCIASV